MAESFVALWRGERSHLSACARFAIPGGVGCGSDRKRRDCQHNFSGVLAPGTLKKLGSRESTRCHIIPAEIPAITPVTGRQKLYFHHMIHRKPPRKLRLSPPQLVCKTMPRMCKISWGGFCRTVSSFLLLLLLLFLLLLRHTPPIPPSSPPSSRFRSHRNIFSLDQHSHASGDRSTSSSSSIRRS